MKQLTAYYLFLLYAASVCKPVSIWFADLLAHSYAAHQHLGVVHHEEGSDHVHQQLVKATKDEASSHKTPANQKANDNLPPHLVSLTGFGLQGLWRHTAFCCVYAACRLPLVAMGVQQPPPRG